ncbi:glycosyltransferase [Blastococcus sp. SYSU DS0617]
MPAQGGERMGRVGEVLGRATGRAQAEALRAAEQRLSALEEQRDVLRRQRDSAREAERRLAQAEARLAELESQAAVLRQQRDQGRAETAALLGQLTGGEAEASASTGQVRRAIGQLRAEGALAGGLVEGAGLDEAAVRAVRALLGNPQSTPRARALVTALQSDERTRSAGDVAAGHYLAAWGSRRTAHEQFSGAPLDLLVRTGAATAVAVALHVDPPEGERLAAQAVGHPELAADDAVALAGTLVGHHRLALARQALDRAREAGSAGSPRPADEAAARSAERLQHWLDTHPAELDSIAPARPRPVIGVLRYDSPDPSLPAATPADHGRTVAVLGHVLRRRGLRLHAEDPDLQDALDELRAGIAAERLLDVPEAGVDVVGVSRDVSRWAALPEPTWLLAAGWFMHQVFGVRSDLPFHAAVRPVFLGFHLDRVELLTPDAVAYLRRYGPVGCRDRATVDLLLTHGVDAFFSGCVATTADLTAGSGTDGAQAPGEPLVDRAVPATGAEVASPDAALAAGLLAARDHHRALRSAAASPAASLHDHLVGAALGLDLELRPASAGDPQLDGLLGLTAGSSELAAVQGLVTELLDLVVGLIAAGADEETVYAAWRERCRPLVEQSRARREHWRTTRPEVESLAGAATPVRAQAVHLGTGGDVHVAIALDQNLVDQAPVVLQGIDEGTGRDVRVHVLTRGVPASTVESWARTFPRLRFSHYRFDEVRYGSIARLLAHTTVSTMDRLLLPDVLGDIDRVVYIDIDVAVLGDVGELWDLELGGAPLAARPSVSEWAASGLVLVDRAAARLPFDRAVELRGWMHAQVDGDFPVFNAGVLVLDLARMRADAFTEKVAGMAGRYGLNDQDVLCCYAADRARALDPRWNVFPTRETVPADARLVHYAGGAKPWQPLQLPVKDLWLSAQERYLRRLPA